MSSIVFEKVSKTYNDNRIIEALDLEVRDGELLVLVGPSGCGKSTLLRMLAGLEEINGGEIRIDGRRINELLPQQRNLSMVFQNYALYPHMTVRRNLGFPLKMQRLARDEIERRVMRTAELLGLTPLLERLPKQLSGGQRQRVAMGRAIVRDAQAFLMDEPLSNLDAKLRVQIRSEIASLQARLGTTTLYVTHDQVEAMTLGQRVAVMRNGKLQQLADPLTLYEQPANAFVASFVGSPGMNLVRVALEGSGAEFRIRLGDITLPLPPTALQRHPGLRQRTGGELLLGIRPEAIRLAGAADEKGLQVRVGSTESLGHETILHTLADIAAVAGDADLPGDTLLAQPGLVCVLSGHKALKPGEGVRLALDVQRLNWFELNGEAIDAAPRGGDASPTTS
jgi:ABC-type sugar transport system ATPase subunit